MIKRAMTVDEENHFISVMLEQARDFKPNCVVGVLTSGMVFATYAIQTLRLDRDMAFGAFDPNTQTLTWIKAPPKFSEQRILFVDDNICSGETYNIVKDYVGQQKHVAWRFAALFTDVDKTPQSVKDAVIVGVDLDWYADPVPSIKKDVSGRFRDARGE